MHKKILLSAALIALTAPLSFAMDTLEIDKGTTKIKMTLQNQMTLPSEQTIEDAFPFAKPAVKLDPIDPASHSIKSLDDLAQYASSRGKTLYLNTSSGRVPQSQYATPLTTVQEWKGEHVIGIYQSGTRPVKAAFLKTQITGAYVDVGMPLSEDTPK